MDQITPCKGGPNFSEETIVFTPLPQATSTVDKRPDLLPGPEITIESHNDSSDLKNNYLRDGLTAINELRQKLDSLGLNNMGNQAGENLTKITEKSSKSVNGFNRFSSLNNSQIEKINKSHNNYPHISNISQSLTDINKISSERPTLKRCSSALASIPTSNVIQPRMNCGNISLPAENAVEQIGTRLLNYSLPCKENEKPKIAGMDPPSFIYSSFTPLPQVSDNIRRNTFKLDVVSNAMDAHHASAREQALKVLNSLDLVPNKEPDCSTYSNQSFPMKSFENASTDKEVSGFSQLLNKSDLQKDESWCNANFGLPIKPGDESMSFLSASQVSLDFMPPDDSLFKELGPADPQKTRYLPPPDTTVSSVSESNFYTPSDNTPKASLTSIKDDKIRESSKYFKDLFSELDSSVCSSIIVPTDMDEYLKEIQKSKSFPGSSTPSPASEMGDSHSDSLLRVSDIAKVLEDVPLDATPISLAKKFMELSDRPSAEKSVQGYRECENIFYEVSVVYGGIVHVDLQSDKCSSQTLWAFQDINTSQVKAVIKSDTNPVKVLLFPLVKNNFTVKVQEVEFDRDGRYFSRLHLIKLFVESPQMEVLGAFELDFGLVPECGIVSVPLTLRCNNSNVLVICPKFELMDMSLFTVAFEDVADEEIHLAPKQDIAIRIFIKPTMGFCEDVTKVTPVLDVLKLCLSPMLGSETLCKIPLKANIFKCQLQVQDSMLEEPIYPGIERQVFFKNSSPCPVNFKLQANGKFNLSLRYVTMKSCEISSVNISFSPTSDKDLEEGELMITVVPGDLNHFIKLKGKINSGDYSFNSGRESRASVSRSSSSMGSVNSSMAMNRSVEPDGSLQLECTSLYLVWPSIGLGSVPVTKSCYIRSKGLSKEKLLIEIDDPSNSFYLVTNERECKKSEIIVLNPHERKNIIVEFCPKLLGQLKAQVIMRRVKSKSKGDSKHINLFGFGGCSNLTALNIAMDLVAEKCNLILQSNFTQEFSLHNHGDGLAFFSISQKKLEGMHLTVSPLNDLIAPGDTRTIRLILQPDTSGSEYAFFQQLLNKDKSTDIVLSSLNIVYGEESIRLRLARLYKKYKKDPKFEKIPQVTSVLKSLIELFPVNKQKMEVVSSLKDPLTSLYDLFNEGIKELAINVITPRKIVEEANLEATQQFINFPEHSQLDETENTTFLDITNLPSHTMFH